MNKIIYIPKPKTFSPELQNFIRKFLHSYTIENHNKSDNDKTNTTALIYEKIRVAVEYQEEHLIFKNAVSRIIRRKYAYSPNITSEELTNDLVSELSWANYINPEVLQKETISAIKRKIDLFLVFLKHGRSGRFKKHELSKMIIDLLACEINEMFRPSKENDIILDFVYDFISPNLEMGDAKISSEDNETQLKLAIFNLILKPDFPLVQHWVFKRVYPDIFISQPEEIKKIARSFDPYYNKIDRILNHPLRKNYISYAKRYIAPFILLRAVLIAQRVDLEHFVEKPALLQELVMNEYERLTEIARQKVWRGTFRALIFILLTKISMAFIIEVPFDHFFTGSVDYISLLINVSLPPTLMLIAGTFVKSPPQNNTKLVGNSIKNIIENRPIDDKKVTLLRIKKPASYLIFNIFYTLFSTVILAGVIWLLLLFNFNFVSIGLFFFFVSVVSFFSFRIRNIALELAMKRSKDDALTSVLELFFLPFIRIGRAISDRFAAFNPAILFLDLLIEAPLKTIIKVVNSWLRFINAKKEELEF
jgi:hypothetical protein